MDYAALKADFAALATSDIAAAITALNAKTTPVTREVQAADIRAILWATMEYAGLVVVASHSDFNSSGISATTGYSKPIVLAAITAVSVLDSGRSISATDTASWTQILAEMDAFVAATPPLMAQATRDKVAALRTVPTPAYPTLTAGDIQTALARG